MVGNCARRIFLRQSGLKIKYRKHLYKNYTTFNALVYTVRFDRGFASRSPDRIHNLS